MKAPPSITPAELLSIFERLHPDRLLVLRSHTGLDDEVLQRLWHKVAFSYDPPRRLATIEYLLLIMHEARAKDARAYLANVFVPWIGIKRRLQDQVMRIVADIARVSELEAYSADDAAHIATKVYRPLVADVFDPFMTLLVATYEFMDDTFVDIETSNLGSGERNKAELVQARIGTFGGPSSLMDGYDPIVRNAISHAGSDGVIYEPRSILFRSIKRGPVPVVETRRWSHEDLHWHVVGLLELVMSIDAACEIFGLDCMEFMAEHDVANQVCYHALDRNQRMAIRHETEDFFEQLRAAEIVSLEERLDLLGRLLFLQCAERRIPCSSVGFNHETKACTVTVPIASKPASDKEIGEQVTLLIRYAILARAVFGTMFERFLIDGAVDNIRAIRVLVPSGALDEYAAEAAGLADLIGEAEAWIDGMPIRMEINEGALAEAEDAMLGPRYPRRGRLLSH